MPDSSRNPLTLARFELRRFKGPLPRLALAFILVVPMLYGCIYLAGNWDPYGRLNQVPVAVVNHDVPTAVNGKEVSAGRDFVDSLHRSGTFAFADASSADAEAGLERGDFYLVITVPESFSRDLVSAKDLDPRRASIELRRNDANGFVIGTITNSAQNSIARAIDETAVRSYFEAVFANLDTIRGGMQKAADGAARLDEGLATAHDGSSALVSGLHTLRSGAAKLSEGAGQVADGTAQLADVVDPVLSAAAERLPEAQKKVQDAADRAADLTAAVADDAARLDDVSSSLSDDLDALLADHPELADDPVVARLSTHAAKLGAFTSSAAEKAAKVADDVAAADTRLHSLGDLSAKATSAKEKVDALRDGAAKVSDGAATLRDGIAEAAEGGDALDDGLAQLSEGAHTLATELAAGAARIPVLTAAEQDDAVTVMSAPVDVTMQVDNPAHVNGRGLAPMFFSIALWMFGISAFFLLRPITGRVLAARGSDLRIGLTAWGTLAATSVVASWIMLAVAWIGLGIAPVHPWLLIALTTLVALAFSAIAHLLRTWLGLVATAGMLLLLILQLTAAGGTYPPEMLPPFFASLGRFMPMRYSIEAFRIAISGGLMSRFVLDVALLALVLLSSVVLLLVVVHRRRRFSMKDLHPPFG
ncbi:MAG: YhgE/Pip domain-containing protein [Tessaracoccus sp.]|uniref:YhgE/Pip domain-containing protein n=1 Tax=Tessaracoccus sp. TaxID=1971211 RepID=UPI001EB4BED2|nr:YhgE/Pip domain-containing protein [Tessaracoccus sp.]MBK7822260.1 YhgE/Pip domain-containing protein [Tessaracoccus sp.]